VAAGQEVKVRQHNTLHGTMHLMLGDLQQRQQAACHAGEPDEDELLAGSQCEVLSITVTSKPSAWTITRKLQQQQRAVCRVGNLTRSGCRAGSQGETRLRTTRSIR
jgi:hypothetical protein